MKSYFICSCILLVFVLQACQSNRETEPKKGGIVKYKITGKVDNNEGMQVYLQNYENELQQFQKTTVQNGEFLLEGELANDGIYNLIVKADYNGKDKGKKSFHKTYPLFLENNCDYHFKVLQYQAGNVIQTAEIVTNSEAANDLFAFEKEVAKRKLAIEGKWNALSREAAQLEASLMTIGKGEDKKYAYAVDRMREAREESAALRSKDPQAEVGAVFVRKPEHRTSLMTPYLFKYISIDESNYATYWTALDSLDASIQQHPLTAAAKAKVGRIKDFYEHMPSFPKITPRNVKGDSLDIVKFQDSKMLIVALWSSRDRFSKMDIPQLIAKESQLKKMGISVVYLSIEKQFEEWEAGSKSMNIGLNNYLLNVTDRDFIVNNYNISRFPAYLWVEPRSLKIKELKGADPATPEFMTKIKQAVQ
jgi:hypothetical protein